jgi:hypothetical protein
VKLVRGTIDFQYDFHDDLVIARSRWHLDSSAEATRWYQMHARYFTSRFSRPKDLISVEEEFDVRPDVAQLWGGYFAKLHEGFVRFSVRVKKPERLSTPPLGQRHAPSAVEAGTVEQAVAAIGLMRKGEKKLNPSGVSRRSSASMRLLLDEAPKTPK